MTVIAAPSRVEPGAPAAARERMIRSIAALQRGVFDVLIVGGGIYGAWAACDAVRRGLSVALIEQDDFGSGTSSNSQKIIHGGLRYLQHGHLRRMRESIRERRTLLRIAPHLVAPMPVLVPIYARRRPGSAAMRAALWINDLLSMDRNRGVLPSHTIGRGRIVSRNECVQAAPGLPRDGLRGGALFHDAQVRHPERLLMSVLWAAVREGAVIANGVRLSGFARDPSDGRIGGAVAEDIVTGTRLTIRAALTVNCTGPWLAQTLGLAAIPDAKRRFRVFEAIVLVTRRLTDVAVAVPGRLPYRDGHEVFRKGYRNFFITPWRDVSLIGTFYRPPSEAHHGRRGHDLDDLLAEFNSSWPEAHLRRSDVRHVCSGRLPLDPRAESETDLQYAKRPVIVDHAEEHGVAGLISVCGVKWTTARLVAERAIDLALRRLGRPHVRCETMQLALDAAGPLPPQASRDELVRPLAPGTGVTRAEVMHAVDAEMALSLADVVFRRTDLATAGYPGRAALEACASVMAPMLNWDRARVRSEIERVDEIFSGMGECIEA